LTGATDFFSLGLIRGNQVFGLPLLRYHLGPGRLFFVTNIPANMSSSVSDMIGRFGRLRAVFLAGAGDSPIRLAEGTAVEVTPLHRSLSSLVTRASISLEASFNAAFRVAGDNSCHFRRVSVDLVIINLPMEKAQGGRGGQNCSTSRFNTTAWFSRLVHLFLSSAFVDSNLLISRQSMESLPGLYPPKTRDIAFTPCPSRIERTRPSNCLSNRDVDDVSQSCIDLLYKSRGWLRGHMSACLF